MLQQDEAVSHLFIANVHVPATTMSLFDSDELASILGERAEYCIMCGHGGACMRLCLGNADATSLVTSLLQLLRPNTRRRESAAVFCGFQAKNRNAASANREAEVAFNMRSLAQTIAEEPAFKRVSLSPSRLHRKHLRIMLHSYLQTVVCLDLEKFMHCTLRPLLSISYNRLHLVTGCLFAALM